MLYSRGKIYHAQLFQFVPHTSSEIIYQEYDYQYYYFLSQGFFIHVHRVQFIPEYSKEIYYHERASALYYELFGIWILFFFIVKLFHNRFLHFSDFLEIVFFGSLQQRIILFYRCEAKISFEK